MLRRLRAFCLALPEISAVGSWGHPNFRPGKRTFAAAVRDLAAETIKKIDIFRRSEDSYAYVFYVLQKATSRAY